MRQPQPSLATDAQSKRLGLAAGLLAAAAGQVVASTSRRGRSPSSGLARGLVDAAPGMLIDAGVGLVGKADKPGLAVLATTASGVAGALGAAAAPRSPVLGLATATAPHLTGGYLAHRLGDASPRDTAVATGVAALVSSAAVFPSRRRPSTAATAAAAAAAVIVADRLSRRRERVLVKNHARMPVATRPLPAVPVQDQLRRRDVAPLLARPRELVVIDVTVPEPRVDLDAWRLDIRTPGGSRSYSHAELLALPLEERDMLMVCVHNPVGGTRMGCARWTGLSLGALLDEDPNEDDTRWVVAEAVDGYTNVLPLATARAHGFLALGMAGELLPREHGSPARLLVSGRHGQDGNLKWLRRLTVTDTPPTSYWEARGWIDGTYPVHPSSRIDTPGHHTALKQGQVDVRGYAWAPPVGVDRVQLQVDDSGWIDASLGADLGPDAWRPWAFTWNATPGRHRLSVRCRTTTGHWQDASCATPFPHGVRGLHDITVHVGTGRTAATARRLTTGAADRASWAWRSASAWRSPAHTP